jgi:hypothetical protein
MKRLLSYRLTPAVFDEMACWIVAVGLLVVCSVLSFEMLPVLGYALSFLVLASVFAAWVVLGWQAWNFGRRRIRRGR